MARPKKFPTAPVRIRKDLKLDLKLRAKRKGMSLPDYLNWRLTQ